MSKFAYLPVALCMFCLLNEIIVCLCLIKWWVREVSRLLCCCWWFVRSCVCSSCTIPFIRTGCVAPPTGPITAHHPPLPTHTDHAQTPQSTIHFKIWHLFTYILIIGLFQLPIFVPFIVTRVNYVQRMREHCIVHDIVGTHFCHFEI